MAYSFKKNAATAEETVAETVAEETRAAKTPISNDDVNVRVRLVNKEGSNLIAVCSMTFRGMFFNDIFVKVNKDDNAYFQQASRKRVGKDGQDVKDENGYVIYDPYYGPANKETREEWDRIIMEAVQAEMDKVQ